MQKLVQAKLAPPTSWCPKDSLGYRLKRVLHAWTRQFDQALKPLGVTHLQFITVAAISDLCAAGEVPSQVRVAEWMNQDVMMMSKILRLLETRGILERFAHPDDPRANALKLTSAGHELLQHGKPIVQAAHQAFFGRIPAAEQDALAASLDRLLDGA